MIVDSREKGGIVGKLLKYSEIEVRALDCGDYWIKGENGAIVIERMTYSDFGGKVISGRLWKQMSKCFEHTNQVYVILENPNTMKFMKIEDVGYRGAILSLLGMGVKIIYSRTINDTVQYLERMRKKYEEGGKIAFSETRIKQRKMNARQTAEYMLMGVNGVGKKKAQQLLAGRSLFDVLKLIAERDVISDLERRIKNALNAR